MFAAFRRFWRRITWPVCSMCHGTKVYPYRPHADRNVVAWHWCGACGGTGREVP